MRGLQSCSRGGCATRWQAARAGGSSAQVGPAAQAPPSGGRDGRPGTPGLLLPASRLPAPAEEADLAAAQQHFRALGWEEQDLQLTPTDKTAPVDILLDDLLHRAAALAAQRTSGRDDRFAPLGKCRLVGIAQTEGSLLAAAQAGAAQQLTGAAASAASVSSGCRRRGRCRHRRPRRGGPSSSPGLRRGSSRGSGPAGAVPRRRACAAGLAWRLPQAGQHVARAAGAAVSGSAGSKGGAAARAAAGAGGAALPAGREDPAQGAAGQLFLEVRRAPAPAVLLARRRSCSSSLPHAPVCRLIDDSRQRANNREELASQAKARAVELLKKSSASPRSKRPGSARV